MLGHTLHRAASASSLHPGNGRPPPYPCAPCLPQVHRRSVSAPGSEVPDNTPPRTAVVLRLGSAHCKPQRMSNTFSFIPENPDPNASIQTLPAVIMAPQGTIFGYIQMPVATTSGRQMVTPEALPAMRRPTNVPPPDVYARPAPSPLPPYNAPGRRMPMPRPGMQRMGRREPTRRSRSSSSLRNEVTSSFTQVEQSVQRPEGHMRRAKPSGARPLNTLHEWQSAFATYVPRPPAPKNAWSESPPVSVPAEPKLPSSSTPRRKLSRMRLWKDMLRPTLRRGKLDLNVPRREPDVVEPGAPSTSPPLSAQNSWYFQTLYRDDPDVPEDETGDGFGDAPGSIHSVLHHSAPCSPVSPAPPASCSGLRDGFGRRRGGVH